MTRSNTRKPAEPDFEISRSEVAYRGGVHQAIACCREWIEHCHTFDEAKRLLALAQVDARERRSSREQQNLLLDKIEKKIQARRS
jgi:hypothetical protein